MEVKGLTKFGTYFKIAWQQASLIALQGAYFSACKKILNKVERVLLGVWHFNPLTPKISLVILLTVC